MPMSNLSLSSSWGWW